MLLEHLLCAGYWTYTKHVDLKRNRHAAFLHREYDPQNEADIRHFSKYNTHTYIHT